MSEWITQLTKEMAYLGIALLMFLENMIPRVPSEAIMPMAGFTASEGTLSLVGVIASELLEPLSAHASSMASPVSWALNG